MLTLSTDGATLVGCCSTTAVAVAVGSAVSVAVAVGSVILEDRGPAVGSGHGMGVGVTRSLGVLGTAGCAPPPCSIEESVGLESSTGALPADASWDGPAAMLVGEAPMAAVTTSARSPGLARKRTTMVTRTPMSRYVRLCRFAVIDWISLRRF